MKKLLVVFILVFPVLTQAQNIQKAAEKYCHVTIGGKLFSKKLDVHIDYGTDSLAMEQKPKKEDEVLKGFTNITDVLNYMSEQGWKLVTSMATAANSATDTYHFFFRKEF
ncbi:MAG TPA: hypothetical protein VG738_09835 [Chitinophagaceae bacterium]|nr:hypothetical protein [Chitinophagaceae bacterium]